MSSSSSVSSSASKPVVKAKGDLVTTTTEKFRMFNVVDPEKLTTQIKIFAGLEQRGHLDAGGLDKLIRLRSQQLVILSDALLVDSGSVSLQSAIHALKTDQLASLKSLAALTKLSSDQTIMMEQLVKELDSSSGHSMVASVHSSSQSISPPVLRLSMSSISVNASLSAPLHSSTQHSGALAYPYAPLVNDDDIDGDDGKHAGHHGDDGSSSSAATGGSKRKEVDEGKSANVSTSGAKFAAVKNVSFENVLAHINGTSRDLILLSEGGSPAVTSQKFAFTNIKTAAVEYMSVFVVICNKKGSPETYYVWDERKRPYGAAIEYSIGRVRDRIPGLVSCNVDGLKIGGSLFKIQGAEHRFLAKG